jgi:hypothetical protein
MEVLGRIKVLGLDTKVSDKFTKRDVVVTTDEQYPQDISVQFVQDKCELLDAYKVGDDVKIGINLRGREWVNPQGVAVYFNTIQGWNISNVVDASPINKKPQAQTEADDLPF